MGYEGYQDAIVKINGKGIFSYFLKSGHTLALDAVEVKIEVFKCFLSAVTL